MPKNILIVEDDAFIGQILRAKLEKEGFSATHAGNGEIALTLMDQAKFDAVILDLIMPHFDGFKVLEAMRANPKLANIPVIVASNLNQQEDIDKAMKLGAKGYIVKTDTPLTEIVKKITALL